MNHLWNDLAYILIFFWINFFSIKIFEKTFKFRWYLRKIEFPILKRICVKNIIFTRHIFFKYDYESWTSSFESYANNYLLSLIYKVICIPILYSFKLRTKWPIFQIVHVFFFFNIISQSVNCHHDTGRFMIYCNFDIYFWVKFLSISDAKLPV